MSNDPKPGAFLNVRVLDDAVVEELSTRLRSLLEQASGAIGELTDGVTRSAKVAGEAEETRAELQRRLQLGVRLVQAAEKSAATLAPPLSGGGGIGISRLVLASASMISFSFHPEESKSIRIVA